MRESELYSPTVTKGAIKSGQTLIAFDAVRECTNERCPIVESCPYVHAGKCSVETKFLKTIFQSVLDTIQEKKMTQDLLNKVSLHLMPLYHQLIRFKKRAYAVDDVIWTSVQGGPKVHPIFKEIRECIKAIESTQRSMGIDAEFSRALGMDLLPGKGKTGADLGAPDMWEDWQRPSLADEVFPDGVRKEVKRAKMPEDV